MNWSCLRSAFACSLRLSSALPAVTNNIARRPISVKNSSCFASSLQKQFDKQSHRNHRRYGNIFAVAGPLTFLSVKLKEEQEDEQKDELMIRFKKCEELIQEGELTEAEELAVENLRLAQERKCLEAISYAYDLLVSLEMERGAVTKAEKLYLSNLNKLFARGLADDHNIVLLIKIKQANILIEVHEFLVAKKATNKAKVVSGIAHNKYRSIIKKLKARIDNGDEEKDTFRLLSLAYEGQGRLYVGQGMLQKAMLTFEKVLESSKKGLDSDERMIKVLHYLFIICFKQMNVHVAQQYLEQAIALSRNIGDEHLRKMLLTFGLVKLHIGDLDEAAQSCQESLFLALSAGDGFTAIDANICLEMAAFHRQWMYFALHTPVKQ